MFQTLFVILNNASRKQKEKAVERKSKIYGTTKISNTICCLFILLCTDKINRFGYFQAVYIWKMFILSRELFQWPSYLDWQKFNKHSRNIIIKIRIIGTPVSGQHPKIIGHVESNTHYKHIYFLLLSVI